MGDVDVIRTAVTAMQAGDMDTLGSMLDDAVVLHVPGDNQISGDYEGKQGFFEDFLGKMMGLTDGRFQLEVHDFASSDDHVVGMYTITATRGEDAFSWRHVNVYHVRDGKVVEIFQHPGDVVGWNDFWK